MYQSKFRRNSPERKNRTDKETDNRRGEHKKDYLEKKTNELFDYEGNDRFRDIRAKADKNVRKRHSYSNQRKTRYRLPIYPRNGSRLQQKSATAVTPSGRSIAIPIDNSLYSLELGEIENTGDDVDRSTICSADLDSRQLSPASSVSSSGHPFRNMRRTSGHDSDSSDSYWPGDDDVSDSEIFEYSENQHKQKVRLRESKLSVLFSDKSNDMSQPLNLVFTRNHKNDEEYLKSIEAVVKNMINFEDSTLTQNNSALESLSNESNESENAPSSQIHAASTSNANEKTMSHSDQLQVETPDAKDVYKVENKQLSVNDTQESDKDSKENKYIEAETECVVKTDTCWAELVENPMKFENLDRSTAENKEREKVSNFDTIDDSVEETRSSVLESPEQQTESLSANWFDAQHQYMYHPSMTEFSAVLQTMVYDANGFPNCANMSTGAFGSVGLSGSPGWSGATVIDNTGTGGLTLESLQENSSLCQSSYPEDTVKEYAMEPTFEYPYFEELSRAETYGSNNCVPAMLVGEFVNIGDFSQMNNSVGEMTPLTVADDVITRSAGPEEGEEENVCENELFLPDENQSPSSVFCQSIAQQALTESYIPAFIDPEDGLVYPALHLTDDGLMTVILRKGVFLEMTPEKAVRLVNHEKKLVVALTDNGSRACVIHPGARICQAETTVNAELYFGRKAKMRTDLIMFGNKIKTYKFDYNSATEVVGKPSFRDLSQDESVFFLETDSGFFNHEVMARCHDIMSRAYFHKHQSSGSKVIINGTKIVQNDNCDVTVYIGPIKYMKMSPTKSVLRLKSQFVEIDIEANWNIKIKRGSHLLNVSHLGFVVSNGKIKASLDSKNRFQAFSLPDHRCLMLGQPLLKSRPGVGRQGRYPAGCSSTEPEGDHAGYRKNADQSHGTK